LDGSSATSRTKALRERAAAAHYAIDCAGADPWVALSLVVWPSQAVLEAQARVQVSVRVTGSG